MQYSIALSIAAVAAGVSAQGVESGITPPGGIPQGCQLSPAGSYLIKYEQPPTAATKRSLFKRQSGCDAPGALVVQLKDGILTDKQGRIGAIVANRQFQFDGPPAQTGSVYTGGFSLCGNGSIALGQNFVFYQSLSGTFYNIYDTKQRDDNILVNMNVIPCSGSGASASGSAPPASSGAASVMPDGQPTAGPAPTAASQISDGQVQATSAGASQISDGQVQATSAAASQISDGQVQATAAPNATFSAQPPIATGGAAALAGSGLVVAIGAAVALFL